MSQSSGGHAFDKAKIGYPIEPQTLLRKRNAIRRALSEQKGMVEKKIAILGGSTTAEIKEMLQIFLMDRGIMPRFYESEYNKYYEDVIFDNDQLKQFGPDLIYIHTTNVNIAKFPEHGNSSLSAENLLNEELNRYRSLWDGVRAKFGCPIIQNNFDPPLHRPMGNREAYDPNGSCLFINRLNLRFAEEAQARNYLYIHDINWLAAKVGLVKWKDLKVWYGYKYAISFDAIPAFANSLGSIIGAVFGVAKKCLVLDFDNTLWGGVIGEDGLGGIQIGNETPEGEAHRDLQAYVLKLKERGIILAAASKNDRHTALEGLGHPENLLKSEDFASIKANWRPKHENIRQIASDLNIGINSLLFLDDSAAERDIVRLNEPSVRVPDIGSDVTDFISILDATGEFEPVLISEEDRNRAKMYAANAERLKLAGEYEDYDAFLKFLGMAAHIHKFGSTYLDRISQLTNKTNQFNLTTKRYSVSEIERMANDDAWVTLQGRLSDRYGDNGIVSVVAGFIAQDELTVDLWLMSCRVLKRNMEWSMLNALVHEALNKGVKTIIGEYLPTAKNGMVKNFYREMGFTLLSTSEAAASRWSLKVDQYKIKDCLMEIKDDY
jgi:FkbH-like protein